jgi:hypothetical protein
MREALRVANATAPAGVLKAAFEAMGEDGNYGWLRCVEAEMGRG